jgi:ribosomal protein S27AE
MRFGSINATNTSIQITQYLCSRCHTVLKETAVSEEETGAFNILFYEKEECPKCGSLLPNSLKRRDWKLI